MNCRLLHFVAAIALAACSAPPKPVEIERPAVLPLSIDDAFSFRKVRTFLNDPSTFRVTPNEMINFERAAVNYGAVNALDRRQRVGNYYDFFWRAGRQADITVRLEYRQAKLGNNVRAQELFHPAAKGSQKSSFAVIGDDFINDGAVNAWRCLLIENGRIVGLTQSYLWR